MDRQDRIRALMVYANPQDYAGKAALVLKAHMVTCDQQGRQIRNMDSYIGATDVRNPIDESALRDLCAETVEYAGENTHESHWWNMTYQQPYEVDLRRAEGMARALKHLQKQIARMEQKEGRPMSFGQYLTRVARAFGAKAIITVRDGEQVRGSYDSNDRAYIMNNLGDGAAAVDRKIWQYHAETVKRTA